MARPKIKDYDKLLQNVRNRRSDFDIYGNIQKSILTESFKKERIPKTVRYVYESMQDVSQEYTDKTFEEAERVQNHITKTLVTAGGVIKSVVFDYQGSVPSNTHIKIHSDLDILVIHDNFYYGQTLVAPRTNYTGEPYSDLRELRTNIYNRLSSSFPQATVSNKKAKCVQISGGSLQRKFDILVCSRYYTQEYLSSSQDHLRAISLYNQDENSCEEDHPFTHIYEVDKKDNSFFVDGNFRKIIRLLKTLKMDADKMVDLSSFMITSIMYHMDDYKYSADSDKMSEVLVETSRHLGKVLDEASYRENLMSPNGKEPLFTGSDTKVLSELKRLKKELDDTILDLAEDFKEADSTLIDKRFEKGGIITESLFGLSNAYEVLERARFNY